MMIRTLAYAIGVTAAGSLFLTYAVLAQRSHPLSYVEKGACPFECCTYRTWTPDKDIVVYSKPYGSGRKVGILKRGVRVRGITGEVRTSQPGKITVTKANEGYKPGDVLWVYTPMGEGYYKVWFDGRFREQELPYMSGPYETSFPACKDAADCWYRQETPLRTEWWVKVRSRAGWTGWTRETEHFKGMDSCGG